MRTRQKLIDALAQCVAFADEDLQAEVMQALDEYRAANARVINRLPFVNALVTEIYEVFDPTP